MKLEVHERLAILQLLPMEGNYAALKELRLAREIIGFSAQEAEFYEIRAVPGPDGKQVTQWSTQKASEAIKDIPITGYIASEIRKKLAELENKNKLTNDFYSLYEKFVINYQ